MARASSGERRRLLEDFVRLCEIESPSRSERGVADAVSAELRSLGLAVEEDATRPETGSDAGNLLAGVPGTGVGGPTVLLCAHMDTVPLAGPVEVERDGDVFTNRHEAILGADNKVAVAVLLAVARRLAREPAAASVELLFTVCEERALAGAKAFDRARLRADIAYVFDHASPVGELILAAPTYYRIEADLHGRAAHAGLEPEEGHSAIAAAAAALARIELGRVDPESTVNAGRIEGGTAANVVPEHCRIELEARSLDHARAGALVTEIVDRLTDEAAAGQCDLETQVEEGFRAYRLTRGSEAVCLAAAALEDLGIEPVYRSTASGSDAAVFNAAGLPCVNVADGTVHNHRPDERVSARSIERVLDIALGIVDRAGH